VTLGLALVYLVGMNVFLRTRIFRNLISYEPASLRVEYADAYSLFPGQIHVEGLAIRGRDSSVEWILRIERCKFWVSFLDLTRRKFHASHVAGDGLTLRVRLRVGAEATPEHIAALPPVPGFADPPYKDPGPKPPPLSDAKYNLWAVQLDDVDANHVRELWIDTLRYAGDMRVRGRWLFRPLRWLDIGPATVDARTLDVSYGMRPIAVDLKGTIETTVHPFDVRVPDGLEILDQVSARIALDGHLRAADGLSILVRSGEVAFVRGEGPLEARVVVARGVLVEGTHVAVEAPDGEADIAGISLDAAARAALDVGAAADKATALVTIRLSNLGAGSPNGAAAGAESVALTLTSRELDLAHAFGDTTFTADVRALKIPSFDGWVPSWTRVDVRSGSAAVDAHFEGSVPEKRAEGDLTLSIENLWASHGEDRIAGSARGTFRFDRLLVAERLVSLADGRVDVRDGFVRTSGLELRVQALDVTGHVTVPFLAAHVAGETTALAKGLSLRKSGVDLAANLAAQLTGQYQWSSRQLDLGESEVRLRDLVLHVPQGGAQPDLTATSLTVGAPRLRLGYGDPDGSVTVDLPHAELPDVAKLHGLLPLPATVVIEHGRASASARFRTDLPSGATSGTADLVMPDIALRLASRAFAGALSVKVQGQRRGTATDLSGSTVAFDSASTPARPNQPPDWWARVELMDSELRAAPDFALRARLHAKAKDASPAAAMIANATPVPEWVLRAVPLNDLDLACEIRAGPSSLEVRSLTAHGQADLVEFEYAKRNRTAEWAVLVEAGMIHAGFHGGEGGTQFVLLGARPWFEEKVATLRAREIGGP
jgi:hypothetical protein